MRIEKIVLNGFKSFADKVEFKLDSGITAIVGPNGCGKSNIVDAVRWVLGEQSAKSLRSGQMADVIFGGSSSRKASGMAEVNLHFSNVEGVLAFETDELQISRRLYRSGESEYRINNKICRLKDIRELFMDTGVGARAYSIIEQGQIEQLLVASKTDRRMIFEEAAGISKYKAHKKEALRKLERTEQNLLRLADIVNEVQRQLRSVKLQAGKARNYLQYSKRLKELRVNYCLAEFHKLMTEIQASSKILGELETEFAVVAAEVSKNDALVSELGREVIQTENQINQADNRLVTARGKIEQQLERIDFLRTRIRELQQRKVDAREQMQKLQEQTVEFTNELEQCQGQIRANEQLLKEKQQDLTELEQDIHNVHMQCGSLEADLEDEKSGIIDIVRRTAQLHNEVRSISTYRDNLSEQKMRLSGRAEAARAELEDLLAEEAQYQARLNDIEKVFAELRQSLEGKRAEMDGVSSQLTEDNEALLRRKEARSALQSELMVLTDMESNREGLSSAVKGILRQKNNRQGGLGPQNAKDGILGTLDYVEGIVADVIRADVEYANAVEAALQGKTDALIVNDISAFLNDKDLTGKLEGRVNVVCAERIEPFVDTKDLSKYPSVRGRVIEFVNYEDKYAQLVWKLLGHTIIIDSIDAAGELSKQLGWKYNFVTVAGELFNSDGSMSLGPLGRTTGLISRKSRLRQLQDELAGLAVEICEIEQRLEENTQRREHLSSLCQDLRTAIYEANTEKVEAASRLDIIKQNVTRLTKEQPLISSEVELLAEQISQSVKKQYESKQKLEELETVSTERNGRVAALEVQLAQKRKQQQDKLEQLTDLKVLLGQIAEQRKAAAEKTAGLQSQLRQCRTALESAKTQNQTSAQQIDQAQRDILTCEATVSELFAEKEQAAQHSRSLHQKAESLLERQKQTEELLHQGRNKQAEIEQQLNQVRIEMSNLDVRKTDLTQRVQEELQIDLAEAYQGYDDEQVDWDNVREEIAELRDKIARLGNVNIDAIDQQEGLEKRNEFLTNQVDDLSKSKAKLQQLIARLNRESRQKFVETFGKVRANFQEVFRKLFGGGRADVLLEDPADVLESGIEIIARPPGKETRTLSLLSGGEKAMTALALLFGIFKTKPSPFCFLDEVDAALDEANNERFNLIIKEFQKDSQFIVITHTKRTMSIADVLFGVTMQQQGISKKISVRFDHIDRVVDETAAVA